LFPGPEAVGELRGGLRLIGPIGPIGPIIEETKPK
jgi:hypothetical protein